MRRGDPGDTNDSVVYDVAGLRETVEILSDCWGVPHVYASSVDDVFFAQGFNAARDRLWQMDLWRRRGLGLLSEVFGPDFIERDRAARLFLYRGDAYREWLAYASDTKRIVTAFVNGINEYVRLTRAHPDLLPPEFATMGYGPASWALEDVVRIRSHGLYGNVAEEVARAITLRDFGPEAEALRRGLQPPREPTVPEGLDLSLIPGDVLRVYELATAPVEFEDGPGRGPEGSNNWVVGPSRTATGRPVLANDPHRGQSVPSLRYVAHLCAPGMDMIGAGEPVLPGISIGHNGNIAFGLTIFSIDQEDLYVYEINPETPDEYRYRGCWEPLEVEMQEITVKGRETVEVELKYTRHGPVVYEVPEKRTAFAVRAAWLEPGMAPYLGSIEYMRAGNRDGFLAAMNRWGRPEKTRSSQTRTATSVGNPAGWCPGVPIGMGFCPCPATGATSGTASSTPTSCRWSSTPRALGSPRRTR